MNWHFFRILNHLDFAATACLHQVILYCISFHLFHFKVIMICHQLYNFHLFKDHCRLQTDVHNSSQFGDFDTCDTSLFIYVILCGRTDIAE